MVISVVIINFFVFDVGKIMNLLNLDNVFRMKCVCRKLVVFMLMLKLILEIDNFL